MVRKLLQFCLTPEPEFLTTLLTCNLIFGTQLISACALSNYKSVYIFSMQIVNLYCTVFGGWEIFFSQVEQLLCFLILKRCVYGRVVHVRLLRIEPRALHILANPVLLTLRYIFRPLPTRQYDFYGNFQMLSEFLGENKNSLKETIVKISVFEIYLYSHTNSKILLSYYLNRIILLIFLKLFYFVIISHFQYQYI